MSDAGEGLVDAEARIQERMEELERARTGDRHVEVRNPPLELLRLAHVEMTRQLNNTSNEQRRRVIQQALTEIEGKMADVGDMVGASA
jgi:hypothetical protein